MNKYRFNEAIAFIVFVIAVVLALLVSKNANSKEIASAPNNAGGRIVLTDNPCVLGNKTYRNLNAAYLYSSSGSTLNGCFQVEDDLIHVIWFDNSESRYPINAFILKQKGPTT